MSSSALSCRPWLDKGCAPVHACNVLTLAAKHDVLRLEVPVDDALGMEMAQGQCDLCQVEAAKAGDGKGTAKRDEGKNRHPQRPTRLCLPGRCLLSQDV